MPAAVQRATSVAASGEQRFRVLREQGRLARAAVERRSQDVLGIAVAVRSSAGEGVVPGRCPGRWSVAAARRLPRARRYSSSAVDAPSSAGRWRDEASAEAKPLLDAASGDALGSGCGVGLDVQGVSCGRWCRSSVWRSGLATGACRSSVACRSSPATGGCRSSIAAGASRSSPSSLRIETVLVQRGRRRGLDIRIGVGLRRVARGPDQSLPARFRRAGSAGTGSGSVST